jgi:hypothetical protein
MLHKYRHGNLALQISGSTGRGRGTTGVGKGPPHNGIRGEVNSTTGGGRQGAGRGHSGEAGVLGDGDACSICVVSVWWMID